MPSLRNTIGILVAAGAVATGVMMWRAHHLGHATASDAPCDSGEACHAHDIPADAARAPRLSGRPRMLVFSSQSCPACDRMAPVWKAAVKACGGEHDVVHVDTDQDSGEALAATYAVSLLPSFVSVDAAGREVARLTGVQPQERLEQALEEVRGTPCALVDGPAPSGKML